MTTGKLRAVVDAGAGRSLHHRRADPARPRTNARPQLHRRGGIVDRPGAGSRQPDRAGIDIPGRNHPPACPRQLAELRPDLTFPAHSGERSDIRIAYCPERVLPGRMVLELVENDRIIGGMTPPAPPAPTSSTASSSRGACLMTDASTRRTGQADRERLPRRQHRLRQRAVDDLRRHGPRCLGVIELANRHPRVKILQPGPGVGGHCIAVDPWFIVDGMPEVSRLIRTAREVNDGKPHHIIDRIRRHAERFKDPVIALPGPDLQAQRGRPARKPGPGNHHPHSQGGVGQGAGRGTPHPDPAA